MICTLMQHLFPTMPGVDDALGHMEGFHLKQILQIIWYTVAAGTLQHVMLTGTSPDRKVLH